MAIKINLMPRKDSEATGETQKQPFYFVIVIVFFMICSLVYAGIYSYNTFYLKKQLEAVEKQNNDIQESISMTATPKELGAISTVVLKGKNIQSILTNHLYNSKIYELLESLTIKSVQYKSLSVENNNAGTIVVSITGEAESYNALAKQLIVFKRSKDINEVIFNDAASEKSAKVTFAITLNFDTKIILTQPVVTLSGPDSIRVVKGSKYFDEGAKAADGVDGQIDVTMSGEVNTNDVGVYILTYTATNSVGNSATATRTVEVISN
jgi:hypothetical protein